MKCYLLAMLALCAVTNANAVVVSSPPNPPDPPGASIDKTTIIDFGQQLASFDLFGTLDLDGGLQADGNLGSVFGLYKDDVLLKGLVGNFTALPGDQYAFSFTNLAAGDYDLRFNINGGGDYSLDYTLTPTTPVPEPTTYMMFGVGLLGLGLMLQKRRFV